MHCTFGIEAKNSLSSPRSWRFSFVLYSKSFPILLFTFNLYVKYETYFEVHFIFTYRCPVTPASFAKSIFPLLNAFALCQNQLGIFVSFYFWVLYFVLLICVSVSLPIISHSYACCSHIVSFEVGWTDSLTLFFSYKLF